jgi:hypothetical protein
MYNKNKDWLGEQNFSHWKMVNCTKWAKTRNCENV